MKKQVKRIGLPALLLVVVALVAVLFVQAGAATPYHSDHETEWAATAGTVSGGAEGTHYYLAEDVTATADIEIDGKVDLCLNGHILSLGEYSMHLKDGATLTICDCSASGVGAITADGYAISANAYKNLNGNVTLYSGTISSKTTAVYNSGNGLVSVLGGHVEGKQCAIVNNYAGRVKISNGKVAAQNDAAVQSTCTPTDGYGLTIDGGEVSSTNACAIRVSGSFSLAGAPLITGGEDDIDLANTQKICITAPLTFGTEGKLSVYVAREGTTYPYTFTSGYKTYMDTADFADYFEGSRKYINQYKVSKSDDGELQFIEHSHTWSYQVEGNVLTAVCTRADGLACPLSEAKGGKIVLSAPANTVYNTETKEANLQNDLLGIVPATISAISYQRYADGDWVTETAPKLPGNYRAAITVDQVLASEATVYCPFTITYLETDAEATPTGTATTVNGQLWYSSDIILTSPAGYTISSAADGGYDDTLLLQTDCNGEFTYYLKNVDGEIAQKTILLRRDTQGPVISGVASSAPGDSSFILTGITATDPNGVKNYILRYWKTATQTVTDAVTVQATGMPIRLTGLDVNTQYTYRLVAVDSLGNESEPFEGSFTTMKKSLESAVITIGGSYTYTGAPIVPTDVTVTINGQTLPSDQYTILCENNVKAGVATLSIAATDAGNYSGSTDTTFRILPRAMSSTQLSISVATVIYNGTAQKPQITVKYNAATLQDGTDYTLRYERNGSTTTDLISAGDITVYAVGCDNYSGEIRLAATYTIQRKSLTITAIDQAIAVGGAIQTSVDMVTAVGLEGDDRLDSVTLRRDGHNIVWDGTPVIVNAVGENVNGNYVIDSRGGLCHAMDWDAGSHSLKCTQPGCSYTQGTGDTVAPTATLTVTDGDYTASTDGFTPAMSFIRFTRQNIRFTVSATDALSGVKEISYYVSERAMSEAEIKSHTLWYAYAEGGVTITAQDGKKCAIYVRVTDKAGNCAYLSAGEGLTFDLTSPTVSGVVNGGVYYVTQGITLADLLSGIRVVDVQNCGWNTTVLQGQLRANVTLPGNVSCVYQFRLSDLAGNAAGNGALFEITMKPIATIAEPIADLTIDTVTGYDAATLRAVRATAAGIDTTYATTEEKDAIQDILDRCDALLAKIQNVDEVIRHVTELLDGYHIDTVTSQDRAEISLILADINAVESGNDLTDAQKAAIAPLREKAEALLGRIDAVAAELTRIKDGAAGYDADTITKNDKTAIAALRTAAETLLSGNNLTTLERADLILVREALTNLLNKLVDIEAELARIAAALAAYSKETVKSSDRSAIEELLLAIDDLLNGYGVTEADRTTLAGLRQTAVALLDRIQEVANEMARLEQETEQYQMDTVTSNDRSSLQQLLLDFSAILGGDNLTKTEREDMIAMRVLAGTYLSRLDKIAEETARLTAAVDRYDPTQVRESDRAAILRIIDQIDDLLTYPNHTETEREAITALRQRAADLLTRIDGNVDSRFEVLNRLYAYRIETVKSSDQEEITRLRGEIADLLKETGHSETERKELEDGLAYADALLAEIEKNLATLNRLLAAVNAYDITTVKSSDRAAIEQLIAEMDALAATEHLTEEERTSLAKARETANALLEQIRAAAQAPITDNTQAAAQITAENFNKNDRETLENAKRDIEKALSDYNGNYTEAEKKTLGDEIDRLTDVIKAIERVTTIQEAIDLLPDPDTFNRHDTEIRDLMDSIDEAYGQLTDREKELVDRGRLDSLLSLLVDYSITLGDGSTWQKGSEFALSFQSSGPYAQFVGVKVDGVLLQADQYISFDRGTVVNLQPAYLETLAVGEHSITILFTEDEATAVFYITDVPASQAGNLYVWLIVLIIVCCLAGGGVAVYLVMKKERDTN